MGSYARESLRTIPRRQLTPRHRECSGKKAPSVPCIPTTIACGLAAHLVSNIGTWMQTHRAGLDRPHRAYASQRDCRWHRDVPAVRALTFFCCLLQALPPTISTAASFSSQRKRPWEPWPRTRHPHRRPISSSYGMSMCSRSCLAAPRRSMRQRARPSSRSWSSWMTLSNAVALNSTSFNAGRLIGPAAAGVLIASVGSGWVFLINARFICCGTHLSKPPACRRSPSNQAAPTELAAASSRDFIMYGGGRILRQFCL